MSTQVPAAGEQDSPARGSRWQGLSELGVAALLLALGVAVFVDASGLGAGLGRTGGNGPKAIPYVIGGALVALGVALAVDVLGGAAGSRRAVRTSTCRTARTGRPWRSSSRRSSPTSC